MAAMEREGSAVGSRPEPPTCCCSGPGWQAGGRAWETRLGPSPRPPPRHLSSPAPPPPPGAQPLRARLLPAVPRPHTPPWVCFLGSDLHVRPPLCLPVSASLCLLLSLSPPNLPPPSLPLSLSLANTPAHTHSQEDTLQGWPPLCIYSDVPPSGHLRRPITDQPPQHTGSPSQTPRPTCTSPPVAWRCHTVSRLTRAHHTLSLATATPPPKMPHTVAHSLSECGTSEGVTSSPMPPHTPQARHTISGCQRCRHSVTVSQATIHRQLDVTHIHRQLKLLSVSHPIATSHALFPCCTL